MKIKLLTAILLITSTLLGANKNQEVFDLRKSEPSPAILANPEFAAYYKNNREATNVVNAIMRNESPVTSPESRLLYLYAKSNYNLGDTEHEAIMRKSEHFGINSQYYWNKDEWREYVFGNPGAVNKILSLQARDSTVDQEFVNEYIASIVGLGIVDVLDVPRGYEARFQTYLSTLSIEAAIDTLQKEIIGLITLKEDSPDRNSILIKRRTQLKIYQDLR